MEEDIKILEERIDYFKCHPEGCNWRLSFEDEKEIQSLENLIKGYRELESVLFKIKNVPEWQYQFELSRKEANNYWKSKIKEKIEYFKSYGKHTIKSLYLKQEYEEYVMQDEIDLLQELMEDK